MSTIHHSSHRVRSTRRRRGASGSVAWRVSVFLAVLPITWALLDKGFDQGAHAEYVEAYGAMPPAGAAGARLLDQNFQLNPKASLDYTFRRLRRRRPEPAAGPGAEWAGQPPAVAIGRLVDVLGTPLPGRQVMLWGSAGETLQVTTSREDGSFVLTWGQPLEAGWWLGTGPGDDSVPCVEHSFAPAAHRVDVAHEPGEDPVVVELEIARPPQVDGFVFDALSRVPLGGVAIRIASPHPPWAAVAQGAVSAADGSFSLCVAGIPGDEVLLKAVDRRGWMATLETALGASEHFTLLLRQPGDLQGLVVSDWDGRPVAGAYITVLSSHLAVGEGEDWDITDEDGEWSLMTGAPPADDVSVHVSAEGHGPLVERLAAGTGPHVLRLPAVPELTGRVTAKGSGAPVADALVSLELEGPSSLQALDEDLAFTDDDGHFALDVMSVPLEAATLVVWVPGQQPVKRRLSSIPRGPGGALEVPVVDG